MGFRYLQLEVNKCMAQKGAFPNKGTGKGQVCALFDVLIATDDFP